MAIAYESTGAGTGQQTSASATWTVTKPGGVTDGWLMIATLTTNTTSVVNTVPSGWTLIKTQSSDSDATTHTYWKIAASEGASWDWVFSTTEIGAWAVVSYSGVDTSTPVDGSNSQNNTATLTPNSSAVTPSVDNCMIVGIFGSDPPSSVTATPDTSPAATERIDYSSPDDTGRIYIEDFQQTSAASVSLDCTMDTSDVYAGVVVALRTAAAAAADIPFLVAARRNR